MSKRVYKQLFMVFLSLSIVLGAFPVSPWTGKASAATAEPVQLLNPGFELGRNGDGTLPGWKVTTAATVQDTLVDLSTDTVRSGQASLYFRNKDTNASLTVSSDPIAVSKGDKVTVTAYVYGVDISLNFGLEFTGYNAQMTTTGVTGSYLRVPTTAAVIGKGKWVQISAEYEVQEGAAFVVAALSGGRTTQTVAYVDDVAVSVVRANAPGPGPGPGPGPDHPYLLNPGFERAANPDGTLPGWKVTTAANVLDTYVNLNQTVVRSGASSLYFRNKDTNASLTVSSDPIAVSKGDKVTVTAYVYGVDISLNFGLEFTGYNAQMTTTGVTDSYLRVPTTAAVIGTGRWVQVKGEYTVKEGAAHVVVALSGGRTTQTVAYVDDVDVQIERAGTTPVIADTLPNPSFESPLVGGNIPNWEIVLGSGTAQLAQSPVLDGANSLYFKDSSATEGFRIMSDRFKVNAGSSLTINTNVYVIRQTHNIVPQIYYYSSDGTPLRTDEGLFGSVTLGTNKWSAMRLHTTVPAGAAFARIALYSGEPSETEAYMDDISVTAAPPEVPLDREYPAPEAIGPMVNVNLGQAGAIQTNALGENEIYFVTNGLPGTFYVVDAETGKRKFSQVIPNTEATWAMTVGSDKNVYFAGTKDGMLYRYLPAEKKVENLGYNTADGWVWDLEAIDDKIYGGTYNSTSSGKLFEYDITNKTFRNYGILKQGQQYVRGIAVDGDYVYAGLGTTIELLKVNRHTGAQEAVPIPGHSGGPGGPVADVFVIGDLLFVSVSTINMVVLNKNTGEVVANFQYSNMISEPDPANPKYMYYKYLTNLYRFDLTTYESTRIELSYPLPDTTRVKDMTWIKLTSGGKAGQTVLAIVTQYGEYMWYDPTDGSATFVSLEIDPQPVRIQAFEVGFDGRLYFGGYQRGMSIYNPFTKQIDLNVSAFAQPEGIGFLGERVFYGTYVSAVMYSYDPTKPFVMNQNPNYEYKIAHQDRPFAITSGDNKLFVGTVPDYGYLGGALAIYDEKADTWTQYDHDQVVRNQSIIGLAYKDGLLYGGTSVWGGLGIDPSEPEAKLFVWDVEKGQKIDEFALDIPGIDETPKMIGEISFGPDGLLWGVVDGTIFAMDVTTKQIVKSKMIRPSSYNTSKWLPYHLRWAPDGMLYTTLARKIIVIDPETLQYKIIVNDFLNSMSIGVDGSIYYAPDAGTDLARIAVPQTDATLSSLTVKGEGVPGFSPGIATYKLPAASKGTVQATATQPGAAVQVEESGEEAKITVVGTDGKSTRVYRIVWEQKDDGTTPPAEEPNETETPPAGPGAPIGGGQQPSPGGDGEKTRVVGSDDLIPQSNGSLQVNVQEKTEQVQLPANVAELLKEQGLLTIAAPHVSLSLPSQLFAELQQKAGSSQGGIHSVNVSLAKADETQTSQAVKQIGEQRHAQATARSAWMDVQATAATSQGTIRLEQFAEPIVVSVNVQGGGRPELTHLYRLSEDGKPEYVGGQLVDGVLTAQVTEPGRYIALELNKTFADVAGTHWASRVIQTMASKLIAEGVSDDRFAPDADVTRAEFIALIARSLKLPASPGSASFGDVAADSWYEDAVQAAVRAGLISGYDDGTFAPNRTISREEMAVILVRAYEYQAGKLTGAPAGTSFADADQMSDWARDAVGQAAALGLLSGRDGGQFVPQGQLTRAEAIQVLSKLVK